MKFILRTLCCVFAFSIFSLAPTRVAQAASLKDLTTAHLDTKLLKASQVPERCSSAREFITTFEYLQKHPDLALTREQMFDVASQVAKGCSGAAGRFVKVFEVLSKSGSGTHDAIKIAVELANRPQAYSDTFVLVFTRSYLTKYLNLDYRTSLILANALATNYTGDPRIAAKDFVKLVKFCDSSKGMNYSKPLCGIIAARVVKRAENFDALIAGQFIKLYRFLTSSKGPAAPIATALKIADNVVAQGPEAADNFITAYNYAITNGGLGLPAVQSVAFAENISKDTFYNLKPGIFRKSIASRLPASIVQLNLAPAKN